MATTTCGQCGGQSFELQTIEPTRSRYKFHSIQCSKCGVSIGIVDYYNIGALIQDLGKKLGFNLG